MPISRMDLDGKGAGSPDGLVRRIFEIEPMLPIPVPIEQLCYQLDIASIEELKTKGFEGGLITNAARESGIILINKTSHPFRQRFTMAHELGHFLIPTHMPNAEGRFLCSRSDMLAQSFLEQNKRARMEAEANRFASLILIPPHAMRPKLRHDPNLNRIIKLASEFHVSKEAMARAYTSYHNQTLALIITENNVIRRCYRGSKFPFLNVEPGCNAPKNSILCQGPGKTQSNAISEITECLPDLWINVERGRPAPTLYEQVMHQRDNFSMTMLWLEARERDDDDYDREDNLTSKQRYQDRLTKFSR